MSLYMHGTQYGLSHHNSLLQNFKFSWLCSKMSKFNIKWAGLRYIVLPLQQL